MSNPTKVIKFIKGNRNTYYVPSLKTILSESEYQIVFKNSEHTLDIIENFNQEEPEEVPAVTFKRIK